MNAHGMPRLTRGQKVVLVAATLPMVAAGGLGAWGTYTNITSEFGRSGTALGVVAAGEGATLVLALVMVGLTMLGQSAPAAVRLGLWGAPVAAASIGVAVADSVAEAVVFGLTPMAMTASSEGAGLLARRIVVFRTGVDAEAQRANAVTVQRLAYHRARAVNHPSSSARKRSERASWRLAKRVGVGDEQLGGRLVDVQRERLTQGADAALQGMFGAPVDTPALPPGDPDVKVHTELPAVEPDLPVICGANLDANLLPAVEHVDEDEQEAPAERLSAAEAKAVLIQSWKDGLSTREAGRLATRSSTYAAKVFRELDTTRQQTPARLALVREERSA